MSDQNMDVDATMNVPDNSQLGSHADPINLSSTFSMPPQPPIPSPGPGRDFREIQVKVHIRRPEKDSWIYLGRGVVTQEMVGHASRVVVRTVSSGKILVMFSESSDLQAEKRGNFVVVGCVEGSRVVSWSLNALNNAETLRLLASIELACYKCKQALSDPRQHSKSRRKIERVIKDDKRRRHRRRKDQEALVDAFSKHSLGGDPMVLSDSMAEPNPSAGSTGHT